MMLDPGARGGRLSSPNPALGPLASRRKSLQILESLMATRRSNPEKRRKEPVELVDSMRLDERWNGLPESSARWRTASGAKAGDAAAPVPIAVPPSAIEWKRAVHKRSTSRSPSSVAAKDSNSCPIVKGIASINSVRPTLSTSASSRDLLRNAATSASISSTSRSWRSRRASLAAVGYASFFHFRKTGKEANERTHTYTGTRTRKIHNAMGQRMPCVNPTPERSGRRTFVDCERLTSSFGWICSYTPRAPPKSSFARFAITSLTHMFVEVPAPPWMASIGKCSAPISFARISSHAAQIAEALALSKVSDAFASADAFLT
mmetsp:Transcript_8272/g.27520  ORF Transcript_8272/g.27520 Transcript_8272/m.27520 type:complete len:319 (-) Transcript_8272:219-1175(-)